MAKHALTAFGHIDIPIHGSAIFAIQRRVAHNERLFDQSTLRTSPTDARPPDNPAASASGR